MAKTIDILLKAQMDIKDVRAQAIQMENVFKGLKLDQRLTGELSSSFKKVFDDLLRYENALQDALNNKGDPKYLTTLATSSEKAVKSFDNLLTSFGKLENIDLSKVVKLDTTQIDAWNQRLQDVLVQTENLRNSLVQVADATYKAFSNGLDKKTKEDLEDIQNAYTKYQNSLKSGNVDEIKAAYDNLTDAIQRQGQAYRAQELAAKNNVQAARAQQQQLVDNAKKAEEASIAFTKLTKAKSTFNSTTNANIVNAQGFASKIISLTNTIKQYHQAMGQQGPAGQFAGQFTNNINAVINAANNFQTVSGKFKNGKADVDAYKKSLDNLTTTLAVLQNYSGNTGSPILEQYEKEAKAAAKEAENLKTKNNELITSQENVATAAQDTATRIEKLGQGLKQVNDQASDPQGLRAFNIESEELASLIEREVNKQLGEFKQKLEDLYQSAEKTKHGFESSGQGVRDYSQETNNAIHQTEQLINRFARFTTISGVFTIISKSIRTAFNDVKELDAAMNNIAVVTDMTTKQLWGQIDTYTAMAQATGSSIKGTYEVAQLYYQQGLDTNEVMQMTNETLKFARIAGLDYANATDYMTAALRGFNLQADQVQRVNDIYSNLAANTASSQAEISIAMSKVASLAHNANMELETTAAFLAQIIATTRESPETAGTALKTVVARFAEVKKLFSEGQLLGTDEEGMEIDINKIDTALKTAGMSLNKFILGQQGLDEVFLELASKWDTLTVAQQRYIATQAAGSRQQSRFLALMQNYDGLMETLGYATNSAGKSQEQFNKTLDSLQTKLNNLRTAWTQFVTGIADNELIKGTVDLLTYLLNSINKILDSLEGAPKSLASLLIMIAGLRGAGLVLQGIGKTLGMNIATGGGGWGKALGGILFGKAGVEALGGITKEAVAADGVFKTIGKTLKNSVGKGTGIVGGLSKAFTKLAGAVGGSLAALGIVAGVLAAIGAAAWGVYNAWSKWNEASIFADRMAESANRLAEAAEEAQNSFNNLKQSFDAYDKAIEAMDNCVVGTKEWKAALDNVNQVVLDILNNYPELASIIKTTIDPETGLRTITNVEEVIKEADRRNNIARGSSLIANANAKIAGANAQEVQIIRDLFGYDRNFDLTQLAGLSPDEYLRAISAQAHDMLGGYKPGDHGYGEAKSSSDNFYNAALRSQQAIDNWSKALNEATSQLHIVGQNLADTYIDIKSEDFGAGVKELAAGLYAQASQEEANNLKNLNEKIGIWSGRNDEDLQNLWKDYNHANGTNYELARNAVIGNDQHRQIQYINEFGQATKIAIEDIINVVANAAGTQALLDGAEAYQQAFSSLQKQGGDDIANLFNDFFANDKNFTTLTQNLQDKLNDFLNKDIDWNELFGGEENFDKILKGLGLEDAAAFEQALEDAVNIQFETAAANIRNKVPKQLFAELFDNRTFADLRDSELQEVAQQFQSIYEQIGKEGVINFSQILTGLGDDIVDFVTIIQQYNWENGSVEGFINQLKTLGINVDSINLEPLIQQMINAHKSARTLETAQEKYKTLQEALDKVTSGKEIDPDVYKTLSANAREYFMLTADGTYKLIGDAKEFYNLVHKESIQDFEDIIDASEQNIKTLQALSNEDYNALAKNAYNIEEGVSDKGLIRRQLAYLQGAGYQDQGTLQEWKEALESGTVTNDVADKIYQAVIEIGDKLSNPEDYQGLIESAEKEGYNARLSKLSSYSTLDEAMGDIRWDEVSSQDQNRLASLLAQTEGTTLGLDWEEVQAYKETLQSLAPALEENEAMAYRVAIANMKMADGFKEIQSNWDDWQEALKNPGTIAYSKALAALGKEVNKLLDLDIEQDFLKTAKAQELLAKAAKGDTKAIDDLRDSYIDWNQASGDFKEFSSQVQTAIDDLQTVTPTLEIGMTLDDAGMTAAFQHLLESGAVTADQLTNILSSAGYEPQIGWQTITVDDTNQQTISGAYTVGENRVPITGSLQSYVGQSVSIPVLNGGQTTYKGPANTTLPSPPKTGGGGGGGGKENNSRPSQDPFYNYIKQREMREHQLKSLQDEAELLTDPYELFENTHQTEQRYQALYGATASYLNAVDDALGKLQDEARDKYSSYISFAEDGSLRLSEAYWNLTGETAEELDNWIDSYDDILGRQQDLTDELADYKKELKELWEGWRDDYIDLTNELADILKEIDEQILEDREEYYNEREEQDQKYLDSVKRNIEEERKARERSQAFEDLAKKQSRLALLQRDTSGMYANEIAKLQSEIDEDQQNMADESVDDILENLQRQLDEDAERHAEILDMMQKQIDANVESRVYIQEAEDVIAQGFDAVQELYQLGEEYRLASDAERSRQLEELKETFADAWKYLEELGEGITSAAEYVAKSINSQTEQINEKITWAVGQISAAVKASAGSGGGGGGYNPSSTSPSSVGNRQKYTDIKSNVTTYDSGASWVGVVTARDAETGKNFYERTTNAHRNIVEDWVSKKRAFLAAKKYKKGGLVDFTGPAWVDGSKSSPEAFLNPEQTQLIAALIQNLQRPAISNFERSSTSNVDNSQFNMEVYIEKLSNDYDLDAAIQKVKDEILSSAQYRNVNIVTRRR